MAAKMPAGNADDNRDDHGNQREFQRSRKQRCEIGQDGSLGAERNAEIAAQHLPKIVQVLMPDRQIVAELLAQLVIAFRRDAVFASHGQDRVAGQQPDECEGADRYADEGRHDQRQFSKQI